MSAEMSPDLRVGWELCLDIKILTCPLETLYFVSFARKSSSMLFKLSESKLLQMDNFFLKLVSIPMDWELRLSGRHYYYL